jgi:hypothetical protein
MYDGAVLSADDWRNALILLGLCVALVAWGLFCEWRQGQ